MAAQEAQQWLYNVMCMCLLVPAASQRSTEYSTAGVTTRSDGRMGTDLIETCSALDDACWEVRNHLSHYPKDAFESYDVYGDEESEVDSDSDDEEDEDEDDEDKEPEMKDNEDLSIEAEFTNGEKMLIYIEKKPMPAGLQLASTYSHTLPVAALPTTPVTSLPRKVYTIIVEKKIDHRAHWTQKDLADICAYDSLLEANRAARNYLRYEVCPGADEDDRSDDEIDYDEEWHEQNRGSATRPYNATMYLLSDWYSVSVSVEELEMKYAKGETDSRKRAASPEHAIDDGSRHEEAKRIKLYGHA